MPPPPRLPPVAARALVYRLATDADREGIERLNHAAFADELGQHAPTPSGRLADRFAADMTYAVAVEGLGEEGDGAAGPRVVGMIGLTDRRPFSLDRKLAAAGTHLDAHLPPHRRACEVRLLAINARRRGGTILRGLIACAAQWCLARGADVVVISGTTRQLRLYRHLGFEAFGPVVGTADVPYQPMFLTLDRFRPVAATFGARLPAVGAEAAAGGDGQAGGAAPSRFLPGPVALRPAVRAAFAEAPVSHRSAAFRADLAEVRRRLHSLTGAAHVAVLVGTGTLANDVVGGQLRRLGTAGVVLACGDFGERLAGQAARWGLAHRVARRPWGQTFRPSDLDAALDCLAPGGWVWTPLCETSTGVLLDLGALRAACDARGLHLALDAVSALGSVPVDLSGVWMASGTSGKGLGAFAGLALVFHRDPVAPAPDLPAYLDLGLYAHPSADVNGDGSAGEIGGGVAFTHASPLVRALGAALAAIPDDATARIATDAAHLRAALRAAGLRPLTADADANPAVTTVVLPAGLSADAAGRAMRHAGFEVACESAYLQARGWVQVCLMGAYDAARLPALVAALAAVTTRGAAAQRVPRATGGAAALVSAPMAARVRP